MKAITLLKKLKDTQRLKNIGYKISQQLEEDIMRVAEMAKMENINTRKINKKVKGQIRDSKKANKQIEQQVNNLYKDLEKDLTSLRLGKKLDTIESIKKRRLKDLERLIIEKKMAEDSVEALNEMLSYYDISIPEYEVFKDEVIKKELLRMSNNKNENELIDLLDTKDFVKKQKNIANKFVKAFNKLKK